MDYKLTTVDGKYSRQLTTQDFKSIFSLAVKSGWRPPASHVHNGSLRLNQVFSMDEASTLAAALERGVQQGVAKLPPQVVVAIFESIAVLRHGESKIVPAPSS